MGSRRDQSSGENCAKTLLKCVSNGLADRSRWGLDSDGRRSALDIHFRFRGTSSTSSFTRRGSKSISDEGNVEKENRVMGLAI